MQIIRGTTPTIIINVKDDIDFSQIASTWIFISQRGKVRVDKTIRDITVNPLERRIKLPLSQEDTLNLKEGDATIQVRILMSDGTALSSLEKEIEVLPTGKEGEIEPEQFTPEQWTVGPEPTIERIRLNLIPIGNMPVCHASQFDKKRQIEIEIYNGAQPYFLSDEELELNIRKPDGNLVSMDIPYEVGSNSVIFETTEQTCAVAGKCLCELRVVKGEKDLGSLNFYLQVEAAPDENGITSQSEINNLARQVHDIVVEELADNGAEETGYDNTESGLEATNVQDAIDEVNAKIENIPSVDAYTKQESDEKYATKTELSAKADVSAIPTKTSDLNNDSGFAQIDDSEESASKTYSSEKINSVLNTKAPASDVVKLGNTVLPLLTTKDFSEVGYIRASDGLFLSAANNFTTPYIPVVAGDKFYIKSFVDNNRAQIAYYTDTSGHGYQAIATGNMTYKETEYTVANNGYVRFSMSYPEYYPLIFYYAGDLSKSFTSYIDKETSKTAGKVDTLDDSIYGKKKITFEIGNITISNSGWVYSDNTKRIRTPNGYTIHLRVGDKIKVTSNTVRIYIGWLADIDNHYYSYGWLQGVGEYSVVSDGKFVMTASLVPEAVLSSVEQVSDYIEVYQARNVDSSVFLMNPNSSVRGVNHKGYCFIAPEDTMPAYKLSKKMGFEFVETDVSFTSDNIPVLLHDNTINRTARNADGSEIATTINISDITFSQSQAYDFGIWKSPDYAGTKIPKFEDFIKYCKYAGLKPYVEIKTSNITEAKVRIICDLVTKYGMDDFVTFISFSSVALGWVASYRPKARLGLLTATIDATVIGYAHDLENGTNEVFFDIDKSAATDANIETLTGEGFAVEVYIIDMLADLQALNPAITGVTTNSLNVPLLLYQYSETL